MDSKEEAKKLYDKSKVYTGSSIYEVLIDMEAGITALIGTFYDKDKKKLEKIRDKIIIDINNSGPEKLEDMIIEATTTLSLATAKLKIVEEMI